ncbi:YopX family protein [Campylobacter jejuni]|nr:hypothetical protein [Campylobacter jejuni]EHN6884716.1 hypothetical protein [Campylobacter jejuni]EJB3817123.1 hypothetical protein [Campylobacter jejuni]EJW3448953.1 hypothetical protein [Campylobacter jejuni]EKC1467733.1 hypothetical protein [Campylobacter jejuni]
MKLQDFDFRIWDKTKEEFLKKEPTLINYANTADIADMFIGNGNDLEIELWTGYFDKNGNKIYENDILEYEPLEELYHIRRDNTYKMFKIEIFSKNFNNKIYKRKAEPDISFLKVFKSEKNMKVIGNIHENKELLNVRL